MSKRNVMYVQVSGVVNAISHVVLLRNKAFFIRLVSGNPLNIVVKNTEHFEWLKFLRVGQAYNFTRCIPKVLNKGTEEELQFVEASAFSKVHEVMMALPLPLMTGTLQAISFSGIIMDDSLSHLGLYELEDKSVLCSSFLYCRANISSLKSMDAISIYNAHSKMNEGVKYLIMCTGSYLLRQASEEQRDSQPLHPIIDVVSAKNLNFEEFLWLKRIYSKLKILLDSGSFQVRKKHVSDVLMNLFFDCKLNDSLPDIKPRSLVKEFMCSPHRCAPLNMKKHPDLHIITTEDCFNYPRTKEINQKLWSYDLYPNFNFIDAKTKSVALVGKLEVNETTANLSLNSGSMPVQCIILSITDFKTEVGSMVNSIVVVKNACLAVETFRISADENGSSFEEKRFVYVLISPGQIYPISDGLEEKFNSNPETGNASEVLRSINGDSRSKSDESQFLSQRFILHHISAPFVYCQERQYFCMVSLLGRPMNPRLLSDLLDEESMKNRRSCCLCMKGEMFKHHPILCENRVYEVRYPVALKEFLFDKRVNLPALQSVANYLPCKSGVIIPNDSILLGPFVSPHLPEDSIVNRDVYGIKESLSGVEDGDIVHLQGIVVARNHQTNMFTQKYKEKPLGFGVPKGKNIVVELKDWVTDETMKVYITAWYLKQYPLGLLIGSSVCITFLQKKRSAKNNHFYQSTCFTRIQILDNPDKCDSSDLFLDDKKRHSFIAKEVGVRCKLYSPFWGVFSISKVWNVEITSICKTCNSVIRYGRCSYVGCLNLLKESAVAARAKHQNAEENLEINTIMDKRSENLRLNLSLLVTSSLKDSFMVVSFSFSFSVDDGSGHANMHAKNDHVRKLLSLSEREWKTLGEMATTKEVMYAYQKEDRLQDGRRKRTTLDLDQVIFKGFCQEAVTTKPWHILCRKFFHSGKEETLRLMCLDVNELDMSRIEPLCL